MEFAELQRQIANDRANGVQRLTARLLRGKLASRGWCAMTEPRYYPAPERGGTWIHGAGVLTSPNPFRVTR